MLSGQLGVAIDPPVVPIVIVPTAVLYANLALVPGRLSLAVMVTDASYRVLGVNTTAACSTPDTTDVVVFIDILPLLNAPMVLAGV